MVEGSPPGPAQSHERFAPASAYIVPFATYLLLTQAAAGWAREYYQWSYTAVVVLTSAVTVYCLRGQRLLTIHSDIAAGVAVGGVGVALWIGLSYLNLERHLHDFLPEWLAPRGRIAFNPYGEIDDPVPRWSFIAVRLIALAMLVPVIEELFWRGFLARWLVALDWQKQPFGKFTPASFAIVTLLFTAAHSEWMAAAVYCALLNGLLMWKRDLWNCVVAHAVSNLLLGVYILLTETWALW